MKKMMLTLLGVACFSVLAQVPVSESAPESVLQPVRIMEPQIVVPHAGNGGTLELAGDFATKAMGELGFYIQLMNTQGGMIKQLRFGADKFIDMSNFEQKVYPEEIVNGEKFNVKLELVANNNYRVLINGLDIFSYAISEKETLDSVRIAPLGTFHPVFTSVKWAGAVVPPVYRVTDAPVGKFMASELFHGFPEGNFEIVYQFKVKQYPNATGHFNFTIVPKKSGATKVQMIFWKKGFQMIMGNDSKWLKDFNPPIEDGNWHEFKLRHTDEDFWEAFLDGKSCESFSAFIEPHALVFGVYDGWLFEVKNLVVRPYSE